jgi:hypothetical protein
LLLTRPMSRDRLRLTLETTQRNNDKLWKGVPEDDPRYTYLLNGYRVLMTRARRRMVIYVPQPDRDDHSRLHDDLDATAGFLVDCGALELN